jgi:hypothetical protein
LIQEECGKKLVQKTSLAITEGGQASELSYVQGGIVHEGMGVSATKTVATEEKPFVEIDELKALSNNVAVVLPSNGDRTLSASIAYLRPLWVYRKYRDLPIETSWLDWPADLRATYDLDDIPQETGWRGWDVDGPIDDAAIVASSDRLGRFVQPVPTDPASSATPTADSTANPAATCPLSSESPVLIGPAAPADAKTELIDEAEFTPSPRIPGDDLRRSGDPFAGLPLDDD